MYKYIYKEEIDEFLANRNIISTLTEGIGILTKEQVRLYLYTNRKRQVRMHPFPLIFNDEGEINEFDTLPNRERMILRFENHTFNGTQSAQICINAPANSILTTNYDYDINTNESVYATFRDNVLTGVTTTAPTNMVDYMLINVRCRLDAKVINPNGCRYYAVSSTHYYYWSNTYQERGIQYQIAINDGSTTVANAIKMYPSGLGTTVASDLNIPTSNESHPDVLMTMKKINYWQANEISGDLDVTFVEVNNGKLNGAFIKI